jgi:hypothetical protein
VPEPVDGDAIMAGDNGPNLSTVESMTVEFARLVRPIGEVGEAAARGNFDPLRRMLDAMGVPKQDIGKGFSTIRTVVSELGSQWTTIEANVLTPIETGSVPTLDQISTAGQAVGELFQRLNQLKGLTVPLETDQEEFVELLFTDSAP